MLLLDAFLVGWLAATAVDGWIADRIDVAAGGRLLVVTLSLLLKDGQLVG